MVENKKYVPAEQLTAFERWELPSLEHGDRRRSVTSERHAMRPPTAQELESIRSTAHEEGFKQGKEEGLRQGLEQGLRDGQTEIVAQLARLGSVMRAYTQPLQQQQEVLERNILDLAFQIARAVIRHEVTADTSPLLSVIREALTQVGRQGERLTVQLNPGDLQMIRDGLKQTGDWDDAWRFVENPTLTPGGCIVETALNYIDATVEARLGTVLHGMQDARACEDDDD